MPAYLGPGVLLAEQVGIEVGRLPLALVGGAPHQLPVAHVVELPPVLLGLAALLEAPHGLWVPWVSRAGAPFPDPRPLCTHRPGPSCSQWSGPVPGWGQGGHWTQGLWPPVLVLPTKSHVTLGPVTVPLV